MHTGMSKDTTVKKAINLVASLHDEGKYYRIIAQLPGLPEEKIRIDLEKNSVTISAADDGKRYKKVIAIPSDARMSKKKFSDGNLELILEKSKGQ